MKKMYDAGMSYTPLTEQYDQRKEKEKNQKNNEIDLVKKNLNDASWKNGEKRSIKIKGEDLSFDKKDLFTKYITKYTDYLR